jgi:hypothetical protein
MIAAFVRRCSACRRHPLTPSGCPHCDRACDGTSCQGACKTVREYLGVNNGKDAKP